MFPMILFSRWLIWIYLLEELAQVATEDSMERVDSMAFPTLKVLLECQPWTISQQTKDILPSPKAKKIFWESF